MERGNRGVTRGNNPADEWFFCMHAREVSRLQFAVTNVFEVYSYF